MNNQLISPSRININHDNIDFEVIVKHDEHEINPSNLTIPSTLCNGYSIFKGANAIDFLGKFCPLKIEKTISFKFKKLVPNAIEPSKERASDSGFDLTLINVKKKMNDTVTLYGTGISVEICAGYYFDLVPRSSIIKTGYILANNVGIIDQGYTGEIMVALAKIDKNSPDLTLPNRLVQLIPREWIHGIPVEITEHGETSRNSGGFGSTG